MNLKYLFEWNFLDGGHLKIIRRKPLFESKTLTSCDVSTAGDVGCITF